MSDNRKWPFTVGDEVVHIFAYSKRKEHGTVSAIDGKTLTLKLGNNCYRFLDLDHTGTSCQK